MGKTTWMTMVTLSIGLLFALHSADASPFRFRRQTFAYDPELRAYARPHPGTRIILGTVQRYAPQEWPDWYTRTIFKWNGETRHSPYHPNDVRFGAQDRRAVRIV